MKFYTRHKILTWVVIICIALAGTYFGMRDGSDGSVETQVVEPTTVRQFVDETGVIESAREANLSLEQTGKVASVLVAKGSVVSAGDTLVLLDQSEQQANLLSARAQLRVEEATLADMVANAEGLTGSDSDLILNQDFRLAHQRK